MSPHPWLAAETRHIARARALTVLDSVALLDPGRRAAAYTAAGLAAPTAAEDAEALRREQVYGALRRGLPRPASGIGRAGAGIFHVPVARRDELRPAAQACQAAAE